MLAITLSASSAAKFVLNRSLIFSSHPSVSQSFRIRVVGALPRFTQAAKLSTDSVSSRSASAKARASRSYMLALTFLSASS